MRDLPSTTSTLYMHGVEGWIDSLMHASILQGLLSPRNPIEIGHFHDDGIWLQLPEFISFLLSYLNLPIPLRIKEH